MFIISLKPLGLCRSSLQEAYKNIFIRIFGERKSLKCKIEQMSYNSGLQYVIYIVNANMRLFGSQFHKQVLQLYHCIKMFNFSVIKKNPKANSFPPTEYILHENIALCNFLAVIFANRL